MNIALRQDLRAGVLDTPLGKDKLVLSRFDGSEGVSELFEWRIEALSVDGDIDFDKLLGMNLTLTISGTAGGKRKFDGILTEAQWLGVRDHFHAYRLVLRPWLWLLSHRTDCFIFHNKSVTAIIAEVYARHGFVCDGVERLGDVVPGLCEPAPLSGWVERPWPSGAEEVLPHLRRGMPAFARSARHLCVETVGGLAQAIVLDTAGGPAVAEWQGDEEDVARLLVASLPGRWTCNAIEGDRLLEVLRHQGCTVQLRPTGTRFVRWLTPQTDRVLPTLRVLDRI